MTLITYRTLYLGSKFEGALHPSGKVWWQENEADGHSHDLQKPESDENACSPKFLLPFSPRPQIMDHHPHS